MSMREVIEIPGDKVKRVYLKLINKESSEYIAVPELDDVINVGDLVLIKKEGAVYVAAPQSVVNIIKRLQEENEMLRKRLEELEKKLEQLSKVVESVEIDKPKSETVEETESEAKAEDKDKVETKAEIGKKVKRK